MIIAKLDISSMVTGAGHHIRSLGDWMLTLEFAFALWLCGMYFREWTESRESEYSVLACRQ